MPKKSIISEIVEKISLRGAAMPSKIFKSGSMIALIASDINFSNAESNPFTNVSMPQRASDQKSSTAPKRKSVINCKILSYKLSILQPIFAKVSSRNF